MGLREQIRNASSVDEINTLISKGKNFEMASPRTVQSWKSTARFRITQLESNDSSQTPEKPVKSEKKKVVSKKKK